MPHIAMIRHRFESAIARWDRRYNGKNHHAGAIALLRLDEAMQEIEAGRDVREVLSENFNDRLLTMLLAAIPLSAASTPPHVARSCRA